MPTYAYACTSCGHEFEAVQSITDAALTACPECAGALRKVFHPVGVAFKGSGFYRTDSRAGSGGSTPSTAAKPSGTAASESAGSGSGSAGSGSTTPAATSKPASKPAPSSSTGG